MNLLYHKHFHTAKKSEGGWINMFFSIIHTFVSSIINFSKNIIYSSTLQFKKVIDFCVKFINFRCISCIFSNTLQPSMNSEKQKSDDMKRTSLSTLNSGIISVEASIALPIFLFSITIVIYFFNIMYTQNIFQERLSIIGKQFSTMQYLSPTSFSQNEFFTDEIENYIEASNIVNKKKGIIFSLSNYDKNTRFLTLVIHYKIALPFCHNTFAIPITQFCKLKLFNGLPITTNINDTDFYVYLTTSGSVYHTNKYCSYLHKYTEIIDYSKNNVLSYIICSKCKNMVKEYSYLYLTTTGDCYHTTLDCPIFTRNIIALKFSEIQASSCPYSLCSRCEKQVED